MKSVFGFSGGSRSLGGSERIPNELINVPDIYHLRILSLISRSTCYLDIFSWAYSSIFFIRRGKLHEPFMNHSTLYFLSRTHRLSIALQKTAFYTLKYYLNKH
jgi:hypothetical protein